jgi:glycogen debranching enzyme
MTDDTHVQDRYHINSGSSRIDLRTCVLKQADSFAVLDRVGGVESGEPTEFGLFHQDTRFLSLLTIRMSVGCHLPRPLVLLSSALTDDNAVLKVHLTNPGMEDLDEPGLPQGALHMLRSQVLWRGSLCDRLRIHNYGVRPVRFTLHVAFGADFADIFEARGVKRQRRGELLPARVGRDHVVLGYEGLDRRLRRSRIVFDPVPMALHAARAAFEVELQPHGAVTLRWTVGCEAQAGREEAAVAKDAESPESTQWYEAAVQQMAAKMSASRAAEPRLHTSNNQFNDWIGRSLADLYMLATDTAHGRYPYAGVPWFSTPFGRDGIIAALQSLWFAPDLARGVLCFLASTQAEHESAEQDAQPGKILHETRGGEMAAMGEVPFGRYYGSIDSTPLFLMLAGAYWRRTGDVELVDSLWPNVERALRWLDRHGDTDGDGFVEYERRTERGLANQGWKDSFDAVFHADGTLVEAPIALCEVQGYVYEARRSAAELARALGDEARAATLEEQAAALRERFERAFWCEDLGTYALALDGRKRPCRVRTSNAGQCLYTGIASAERARRVADTIMSESGFSGWGVRTVASVESRYSPMSYHDGSVWPHDNAVIAAGFGRYGLRDHAARILGGLFDASLYFDLYRLPELFCGFARDRGEPPTLYPHACAPQAWAAAAPLMCLQACLGLEVDGTQGRVCFRNPVLPPFIEQIHLEGLRLKQGTMDFVITRHDSDVAVRMTRREGDVELLVML